MQPLMPCAIISRTVVWCGVVRRRIVLIVTYVMSHQTMGTCIHSHRDPSSDVTFGMFFTSAVEQSSLHPASNTALRTAFLTNHFKQREHSTDTYTHLQMCLRERDSLSDKLKMMDTGHLDRVAQSDLEDTGSRRGVTGYTGDLTVEQAYEDLKAEYKVNAKQIGIHYVTENNDEVDSKKSISCSHCKLLSYFIRRILKFLVYTHYFIP